MTILLKFLEILLKFISYLVICYLLAKELKIEKKVEKWKLEKKLKRRNRDGE